jgi:alpha-tubulin suppressor-like RCC1 family protein
VTKIAASFQSTFVLVSEVTCYGKTATDTSICSGKGFCSRTNYCSCGTGYSGNQCEFYSCHGKNISDPTVCSGLGVCADIDTCNCNVGFDGKQCDIVTSQPKYYKAYTFGRNTNGQLADGSTNNINTPIEIGSSVNYIEKASGGIDYQFVLTNYSKVYAAGNNNYGQLLIKGDLSDKRQLTEISPQNYDIEDISAGNGNTLILTKNRTAFGIGRNHFGQLGIGNKIDAVVLTQLQAFFSNVTKISTYEEHSLMLINGNVYSFGNGANGRLGLGDNSDRTVPTLIFGHINIIDISVAVEHSLILNSLGKVYAFGRGRFAPIGDFTLDDRNVPTLVATDKNQNIVKISAGEFHSLMLDKNGIVYSFGLGNVGICLIKIKEGELGDKLRDFTGFQYQKPFPTDIDIKARFVDIDGAQDCSYFLRGNGRFYSTGKNTVRPIYSYNSLANSVWGTTIKDNLLQLFQTFLIL